MTDERLLRLKDVVQMVALSKSEIYRRLEAGNFPRQVRPTPNTARWKLSDIRAWIDGLGA